MSKHPEAAGLSDADIDELIDEHCDSYSDLLLHRNHPTVVAICRAIEAEVTRRNAEKHKRLRAALSEAEIKLNRVLYAMSQENGDFSKEIRWVVRDLRAALSAEPGEKP